MKAINAFIKNRPLTAVLSAALLIVAAGGILLVASMQSWPSQIFSFEKPDQRGLSEQEYISGWTSISRNSINVGGTIDYRITILYRPGVVKPDLEAFERGVDVLPFNKREVRETERAAGGGVNEYVLDYVLQAVDVQTHASYQLDPAVLFYTAEGRSALQSLEISSPRVHIVGYYPRDITGIALQELKEEISDPSALRQALMGVGGIALLGLCAYLLWKFGRRRRKDEFLQAETLWQEFHGLDAQSSGSRVYILWCETIFTRLLRLFTGLDPAAFWSGDNPADEFWEGRSVRARRLFQLNYEPEQPSGGLVEQVNSLLKEAFSAVVEEEGLQREQEPSFTKRLLQQPRIVAAGGFMAAAGLLMVILASLPALWLSPDVLRYNGFIAAIHDAREKGDTLPLEKAAANFIELAESIEDDTPVKAASLYNAGTILADSFSGLNQALLARLESLFSEMPLSEVLDHDPERSLATLTRIQASLQQGERHLRNAVRVDYRDEDFGRNLEIVMKRRQEVLTVMSDLLARGHVEALDTDELLDLINSEMALEFEVDEGQEAPGYYIGEYF